MAQQHILAIDDNDDSLSLFEDILKPRGFLLTVARSGEEALRILERSTPDLILLDIMMPGMNGFEFLQRIRSDARTATIPVILQTAHASPENAQAFLQTGLDYMLCKPLRIDVFLDAIRQSLRRPAAR